MKKLIFITAAVLSFFAAKFTSDWMFSIRPPDDGEGPIILLFLWAIFCILFFLIGVRGFPRRDIYCTWCGTRKVKYLEGETGDWYWEYRNQDGSQDKRVKDNYQKASFLSKWQCKKCDAVSRYNHYVNKNPSKSAKVWKGWLLSDGKGERKKTDYDKSKDGEAVDSKSANRKN